VTAATIAPWLSVRDAGLAVEFYRQALGAIVRHHMEAEGVLQVAQMSIQDAPFWVQRDDDLSVNTDPGRAVRMIILNDDPDTMFARALDAGATQIAPVHEEHGWRTGRIADPFGHQWEFARHAE
jgi:PhnB protein